MAPGLSGICGLVHAVAFVDASASYQITGADVDDVWIRRRDFDSPDGRDFLDRVEDRKPGGAGARGLPNATEWEADVEHAWLACHTTDSGNASAAERPDVAPYQPGEEVGFNRTCGAEREQRNQE